MLTLREKFLSTKILGHNFSSVFYLATVTENDTILRGTISVVMLLEH
jgi:hypothetical protein